MLSRFKILIVNALSFESFHATWLCFPMAKFDLMQSLFSSTMGVGMVTTVLSHLSGMGEMEATLSFLGLT